MKHQIVREGTTLCWSSGNTWRFDAQIARREIVFRRIGRNEQSAIQACLTSMPSGNMPRRVLQVRVLAIRLGSRRQAAAAGVKREAEEDWGR